MERASRLIVLASTGAAVLASLWLVDWMPGLQPAGTLLFAAGVVVGVISRSAKAFALREEAKAFALRDKTQTFAFGALLAALAAIAFWTPVILRAAVGLPDYHSIVLWLAPLAGLLVGGSDPRGWHAPEPWRVPIAGWALVVAVSWPIVCGREIDFTLAAAQSYLTPNGLEGGAPRATAAWIAIAALTQLVGLLWFEQLWARFGAEGLRKAERQIIAPLLAGILVGAVIAVYQGTVDLEFLSGGIWPNLQRATGLMLDANSFAMGAALAAPLSLALAWRLGLPTWVGLLLLLVAASGMWVAGSRTALIALGSGLIGVAVALAQRRGAWQARYVPILLLLAGAVVVLVLFVAPRGGNSPSPLQRIFDRLPTPDRVSVGRFVDEMWNRFGYGTAAERMILEHPVAGIGVGSFHVLSPDYVYLTTRTIARADNAQNWWRHQLAELGLAGAIPALICSVLAALLAWRGRGSGDRRDASTVVRAVLTGLGAASLFGVSIQHPAMWLLAATVLYWAGALADAAPANQAAPHARGPAWLGVWALAVTCAVAHTVAATGSLRVPIRAQRAGFVYLYGLAPPELLPDYGYVRWIDTHAVAVITPEQRWLELTVWAPPERLAGGAVDVRITWNDRPVLDATLTDERPITRFVPAGDDPRLTRLEFAATAGPVPHRAVQVGWRWHERLPDGVAGDAVVR